MASVRLTDGFPRNLLAIERHWIDVGAPRVFDDLVDRLIDTVIPNLEQFPDIGKPLLDVPAGSVESRAAAEALALKAGDIVLRQYVANDYLLLYAVSGPDITVLSIRHHGQLSFDLGGIWLAGL